jgi:hypothetical protein
MLGHGSCCPEVNEPPNQIGTGRVTHREDFACIMSSREMGIYNNFLSPLKCLPNGLESCYFVMETAFPSSLALQF